jgi:hypothetical protein
MAGLDALTNYNWGGLLNTSMWIVLWIFIILFVVGVGIFLWWVYSFKHIVVIKRRVGKSYTVKLGDKFLKYRPWWQFWKPKMPEVAEEAPEGKVEYIDNIPYLIRIYHAKIKTERNGIKYLKLQYNKLRLKIPGAEFHNMTTKGNLYFELVQVNEHIYWPTVLSDSEKAKTTIVPDENYFHWAIQDMEESFDKYKAKQSFWEKYGAQIMIVGMLVIILLIIYVTFKDMKEMMNQTANSLAGLADKMNQAADKLSAASAEQIVK